MRQTALLGIFLFYSFRVLAQTALDTDGLNNLNNVFLFSLKEYCKELDSTKTKVVYVEENHFIGDSWPKQINGFEIKYLSKREDYIKVIKENNASATIVGICPFEFRKGQFSCGIIPFSATYSKKIINLANGGGLTIYFDYDPILKGMIYKNKKWSGI